MELFLTFQVDGKNKGAILSVKTGYKILQAGGSALEAVEKAIHVMEADTNFNAGNGSVLSEDGEVEMDACIMDGSNMKVGAVTAIKNILHPISLARAVMEKTFYNFLGAKGAMTLAINQSFPILEPGELVTQAARDALARYLLTRDPTIKENIGEGGTVGCVARDSKGNLAAGTSTGGLVGKLSGRIGDTPIVGGGTYADNKMGAMSATGTGEVIMKAVLVFDILRTASLTKESLNNVAAQKVKEMMDRYNGDGGVIGIDRNGRFAMAFSSPQMSWASQNSIDKIHYGVNPGENFITRA
ncbi:isoaspartyl peptidase/L-asparaginase-like [Chironomus tepperi]|uniref:isoaspartyl peptidase/L-asparaginase-like n=1 Tax=Chironomus tepperi TaxID=113505 RepID=UPI00391EEBB3